MIPLATIGYESAPQARVIETLKAAGVEVLIDVRAVAASRRAGFSKGLLSSSLRDAGIDYVHLRELGTPKEGRIAARHGRTAEMRAIFEAHLAEPAAQLQLAQASRSPRRARPPCSATRPTTGAATARSSPNACSRPPHSRSRTSRPRRSRFPLGPGAMIDP